MLELPASTFDDDPGIQAIVRTQLYYLRSAQCGAVAGKEAFSGPYMELVLARIYMLLGEPEQALDQLEPLLKMPYYLSPGWLRIDPTWDPLRNNPRFKRMVEGTA